MSLVLGTARALFSDEDNGEDLLYPTLLNVAYDAESSHAGSVVILFEGIEGENVLYRIYKASTPLSRPQDLTSADLAAEVSIGRLPYRDVPREEGKYHYAVTAILGACVTAAGRDFFPLTLEENTPYYFVITAVNRLGAENRALTPGENASAGPFELEPSARPAVKADEAVKKPEPEPPRPLEDKGASTTPSPGAAIDRVLTTRFNKGEYTEALEGFRSILAREGLSTSEKSAVHFYMGQCEFYLGAYRNAIRSFIFSKEDPKRKKPADAWIDRCLERVD